MIEAELRKESEFANKVTEYIDNELIRLESSNPFESTFDKRAAEQIAKINQKKEEALKKAREFPFFGRIDFKPDSNQQCQEDDIPEHCYIGKTTVFDDYFDLVVLDWRAPISSLYYEADIGRTSYEAPIGVISGDLSLKRQYKFEKGNLIKYSDITCATNDELLQSVLSETSETRLKNIVATIQSEQNRVIRQKINEDLIVQGVAGSGKTTVALHRIAYLLYAYKKTLLPENILILAPNKFFLDYISDTLPDLGVEDINQMTYEDFSKYLTGISQNVISQNERILSQNKNQDVLNYRCSMAFKSALDAYIDDLDKKITSSFEGFEIAGEHLVSENAIRKLFEEYKEFSIKARLERVKNYIISQVQSMIDSYMISPSVVDEVKKKVKSTATSYIKKYLPKNLTEVYKAFIGNKEYFNKTFYLDMVKEVHASLKNKLISYEDLPSLIYLYHRIYGIEKEKFPKYIVIDEAQDLGELHIAVLKAVFPNSKFAIFGDITQGIYARGIDDWDKVNEDIFNGNAKVIDLVQSYRTSVEIMEEANKIAKVLQKSIRIKLATSVLRHSKKVQYHQGYSFNEIVNQINELKKSGAKNIALITKTNDDAKRVFKALSKEVQLSLIDDSTSTYTGGTTVLSSYLSKGLEFDSVILLNPESYENSTLDGKLLYVAMTRAMHTLDVYQNEKSYWI